MITARTAFLFPALLTVCLCMAPPVCRASSVSALTSIYEKHLQKIQSEHRDAQKKALDDYGSALNACMTTLQKQGDLEGFLSVKKEVDRFAPSKTVPLTPTLGSSPLVATLQATYHAKVRQNANEKHRNTVALAEKYTASLESLKKTLTIKGDFANALAAKEEIDRVQKSGPVTAARFALADLEVKKIPVEIQPVPTAAPKKMIACSQCNGSGKGGVPCPDCRGSGRCRACNGTGRRPSGFRGSNAMIGCIACKKSGKCRDCEGSGKRGGDCPACEGKGQVEAPAETPAPVPSDTQAHSSPAKKAHTPAPPVGSTKDLTDYTERLKALHAAYQARQWVSGDLESVVRNPEKYVGKLYASRAFLVDARPRRVRVAATEHDAKLGGHSLVPFSVDIGDRASKLSWKLARNDQVAIIYGVVSKDHLSLFRIKRLPSAKEE